MLFELSVIIVNYNVRFFLEYCLLSLQKATKGINVQIIVVDNASTDDNYDWIPSNFPNITFLKNSVNIGFGKANNLGISHAQGKYVLLLNPDTLIPETALVDCLNFIEKQKDCGALGVHMMDGQGQFLPESKRSLPTPAISFYKFSGLERLFPQSRLFGQYTLGYLDDTGTFPVCILAGAFMIIRKSLLDKVGGFDERFFMYGEDIDLSYRLQNETGFKNYFLGSVKILHFKGESSKQDTLQYHKIFNDGMQVFVKKYYNKGKAFLMQSTIAMVTHLKTLSLFFRKKHPLTRIENINQTCVFPLGDQNAITQLKEKLLKKFPAISFDAEINTAQTIIFCIGKNFPYQEALDILHSKYRHTPIYWYDEDSHSIIGSNNKNDTGIVIPLYE